MNPVSTYPLNALPAQFVEAGAERDAAQALDIVFIEGFVGETIIGIHDGEFDRTQPLVVDVHAGVPRAVACDTDHIADTIDYSVVRERLRTLFVEHRHKLLEALAENIATMLLDDFGAAWVRVKVVKPKKFNDVAAMGVLIERRAAVQKPRATEAPAGASGSRGAAVLQLIGAGMVPGRR